MDFAFTEEQELLRRAARELMDDRYPLDRVIGVADAAEGFPRDEWSAIAEVGWTGIAVPESDGGAGLGSLDELIVVEELGRALYPGPFLGCVVMALPILQAAGASELVANVVSGERVATVAWAGEDGRFDVDPAPKLSWDGERLSGTRLFVPGLGESDLLVVVGATPEGTAAWAVDRGSRGVAWRELPTVDRTRRMGEVVLQDAPAAMLRIEGDRVLSAVRDRALAALAAEAVGAGSRAIDLALDHARTRQQFGRPIGAFQAVSHQLAQAFAEVETARSLVYWAGWAVSQNAPEASVAAAAARVRAGEAAAFACERAIQVHGGIGFTWEHPLHRFYKRVLAIGAFLGSADELRARVAASILD